MLAAALLAATLCTPLAHRGNAGGQDAYALYVRDGDGVSVVRIDKESGVRQTIARFASPIHAVDVDGARVYVGDDALHVVTIFGGEPAALTTPGGGVFWIGHDEENVYWLERTGDGRFALRALAKRSGELRTLVDDAPADPANLTAAAGETNIWFNTERGLYFVRKDGSEAWVTGGRDVFEHGGAVFGNTDAETYIPTGIFMRGEDGSTFTGIDITGLFPHLDLISGDLAFYSVLGHRSFVRHICAHTDDPVSVDLTKSEAMLADSCATYFVDGAGDVTRLAGAGDFRIDSITPAHALPGTRIAINGTGFRRGLSLKIGAHDMQPLLVDETQIIAVAPPFSPYTNAPVVAVQNPDGRCAGAYFTLDPPD